MAAPLPPASWYPDPSGAAGQRYFDGTRWTVSHAPPPPSIVINNVVGGPGSPADASRSEPVRPG